MAAEEIIIDGQNFTHVKTRAYTPISVYRGEGTFLRIGVRNELEKEARDHAKLLELGFPVPKIIAEGEQDGQFYYIESSFGDKHLGEIFAKEFKETGAVSSESFQSLLDVTKQYANAQLKIATKNDWKGDFFGLAHIDWILDELPELADKTQAAFEKNSERLKTLPSVLTHGDFNPWNLFAAGVIDLEKFNNAPVGYDLVTNLYHIFVFPPEGDFEMTRSYMFNDEQEEKYLAEMDRIFESNELPKFSDYRDDLFFCRIVWAAARMQRWPKVQQWRYNLYRKALNSYLDSGVVINVLKSN